MGLPKPLTIDQINFVHEWYEYDPTSPSGLRWKKSRGKRIQAGQQAGHLAHDDYWMVNTGDRLTQAARAVWLLCGGILPPPYLTLDHINRQRMDNRIENLRVATRRQQNMNRGGTRSYKLSRYR